MTNDHHDKRVPDNLHRPDGEWTPMPRKAPPVYVRCRTCDGEGWKPLSQEYCRTLLLLKKHGPATGTELAPHDRCQPTAMCNRLSRLARMGVIRSTIIGRKRVYEIISESA